MKINMVPCVSGVGEGWKMDIFKKIYFIMIRKKIVKIIFLILNFQFMKV